MVRLRNRQTPNPAQPVKVVKSLAPASQEEAIPMDEAVPQASGLGIQSPQAVIERSQMRPPLREDDSRARAAMRAAQLRDHGALDEGTETSQFHVEANLVPPGWSYEWKRRTTLGKEDPSYQVELARQGWEAVPASRHPELMPQGGRYQTIEREGMVLMERPKEIVDEARARELRKARSQVRMKEAQLSSTPEGQLERHTKDGSLVKINKHFEPMPIQE